MIQLDNSVQMPALAAFHVADLFTEVGVRADQEGHAHEGVKIVTSEGISLWLGDPELVHLLGKEEGPVPATTMTVFIIGPGADGKGMEPAEIFAEIGGETKAEVTLGQVWTLILAQPHGEPGPLVREGNLFVVQGSDGEFYMLRVQFERWQHERPWSLSLHKLRYPRWTTWWGAQLFAPSSD